MRANKHSDAVVFLFFFWYLMNVQNIQVLLLRDHFSKGSATSLTVRAVCQCCVRLAYMCDGAYDRVITVSKDQRNAADELPELCLSRVCLHDRQDRQALHWKRKSQGLKNTREGHCVISYCRVLSREKSTAWGRKSKMSNLKSKTLPCCDCRGLVYSIFLVDSKCLEI